MASAEALPPNAAPLAEALRVEVAVGSAPGQVLLLALTLPARSTVSDALVAASRSQTAAGWPAARWDQLTPSLWGRACAPDAPLQDGDRIDLTRPLTVDPKLARRLRWRRDGVRKPRR